MANANPSRPIDERDILTQELQENAKAEGVKNPEKLPISPKVSQRTRMKEPGQVTRSVRTGNIIKTN